MKKRFAFLIAPLLVATLGSCVLMVGEEDNSVDYQTGKTTTTTTTTQTSLSGSFVIRFGVPVKNIITRFEAEKGRATSYAIGERIALNVTVNRAGFVTLVILDNDGTVDVIASEPVSVGSNRLPARSIFVAGAPSGRSYIRAFFSSTPRVYDSTGRGYTLSAWDSRTQDFLNTLPEDSRDVAEISVDVR